MKTETEQKFSWFPKDGTCPDVFNSIDDAIKDAQERYDKGSEPFEDGDEYVPPVINVGTVRYFDFKDATEKIVDGIEDDIYEQMSDFNFGCDFESECYISRKDKEAFKKEAIEALLPIVDKYVFVNPEWVCTPTKKYDLKNKKWMEE